MAPTSWPASASKPGSLASPFTRHLASFLIAVAGALALSRLAPGVDQPLVWLVGGVAIGLVCGVVGGGWLGLLFVVAGLWIGLWFDPIRQAELPADTLHALSAVGPAYLAAVTGASVAYAVALLIRRRLRESGLIQRPSR
jgi:hypothetical protein